ncbi:cobyrinate a,c-diamide synthase [Desulfopila sp. IMCC35008]|uniref:cobyrinate a,c-diamide synthase n=1 Tax=Desulfopila sp. IMCC35008 TaxID=2653858 RepID=UPI0013D1CD1D|nr:cobyrinate a,c-diamide synthase [Desulfopila sp. IMCC35008]
MTHRPEFLIAATKSGSGKTLLTLGILAALRKRGYNVQPFKCGPDFIDPSLHRLMVERESYNLDLRMMGDKGCRDSYKRYSRDADIVVTEGVMGLFDGGIASSAELAKKLRVPVLLIIDVRSAAESVAAIVKGFEMYDPDVKLCGVICNRIGSERHRDLIDQAVNSHCKTPIVGHFPRNDSFEMPSRHLGLHMGHEIGPELLEVDTLVKAIEGNIDLDAILNQSGQKLSMSQGDIQQKKSEKMRLAVAYDEAFCFYYPENFDILRRHGITPVFFSPLYDEAVPEDVSGIYFGGGYPELHAPQLSNNGPMIDSIRAWADHDGFVYGECGGFMYMCSSLADAQGNVHPMTDLFHVKVQMKERLSSLGYREATLLHDSPIGNSGDICYGHEFHYSEIIERDKELDFLYKLQDARLEGCLRGNCLGSYVHLHFSRTAFLLNTLLRRLPDSC